MTRGEPERSGPTAAGYATGIEDWISRRFMQEPRPGASPTWQAPHLSGSHDKKRLHGSHVLLAICSFGNAAAGESFRFFNPAAAHRLVQIRIRLEELRLRRDQCELRDEQRLLGGP